MLEVFNVFNTPNFDNPGGSAPSNDIASPIFGSLQSTLPNSERVMQFVLIRFPIRKCALVNVDNTTRQKPALRARAHLA